MNYEKELEQLTTQLTAMKAEASYTVKTFLTPSQLAQKLLDWKAAYLKLTALEAEIKPVVFKLKRTQTVDNVEARYSGGRRSYLYKDAAMVKKPSQELLARYIGRYDWRGICTELKISKDDTPFTKSDPSVSIKLLR